MDLICWVMKKQLYSAFSNTGGVKEIKRRGNCGNKWGLMGPGFAFSPNKYTSLKPKQWYF